MGNWKRGGVPRPSILVDYLRFSESLLKRSSNRGAGRARFGSYAD